MPDADRPAHPIVGRELSVFPCTQKLPPRKTLFVNVFLSAKSEYEGLFCKTIPKNCLKYNYLTN